MEVPQGLLRQDHKKNKKHSLVGTNELFPYKRDYVSTRWVWNKENWGRKGQMMSNSIATLKFLLLSDFSVYF